MRRGVGLPRAPSSARCPPVSGVALRCGPPNYREAVGGPHDRLADSAWIVRWAQPARWRHSAWLSDSHNGRHCGSPGCGGAAQSRVAERTSSEHYLSVSRVVLHCGRRIGPGPREAARPAGGFCVAGTVVLQRAAQRFAQWTTPGRISVDDTAAARGAAMLRGLGLPSAP
jgi:hypothetical protein